LVHLSSDNLSCTPFFPFPLRPKCTTNAMPLNYRDYCLVAVLKSLRQQAMPENKKKIAGFLVAPNRMR
jgi:hypothetical protein